MVSQLARRILVFAMVALPWLDAAAVAHEIGTSRVSVVTLDPTAFEIEVITDAVSLLQKLEAISGVSAPMPTDSQGLRSRLERQESIFQQRVTVAFDGHAVRPTIRWNVAPADMNGGGQIVTVLLAGEVPASARHLTWKYGWTFTAYSLADRRAATGAATQWLDGGEVSAPLSTDADPSAVSRLRLAGRYMLLGFTHIVPKGLDHVLFVLGICLLSRGLRPILLQVTAFTIAHSITLALSIYGVVRLTPSIVEPAIALSIAYIAIENVVTTGLRPWRYVVVFAFGLLHGLGFAGVLAEVGLPRGEFLTALLAFNAGVELGQLAVIGGAFVLVGYWFRHREWYRQRIVLPASAAIALFGIYWTFERLV